MIYSQEEDSFLLEKAVKKYSNGKSFLDMGAGSGIQSLSAFKSGAKSVLAVDINPECRKELSKYNIPFIKSNLFSKVSGKFDLIAFNPPYLPIDKREDKESRLATTGGKKGDEVILRFLKQSKKHLSEKGKILLLLSSLTPMKRINSLLLLMNYKKSKILSKKIFFEELFVLKIERKK